MKIAIVAGELSGDQLGEGIVKILKAKYPNAIIEGIGGQKMIAQGLKSLYPMETLSVMGIMEILPNLIHILKIRNNIIKYFIKNKPDVFIGIDAPDFNLFVEEKLSKKGIKTIHYVSPSVWAWREGRVKKIKRATNTILCILPFEKNFYKKHNHKAIFVGHPLAKKIPLTIDRYTYRDIIDINLNKNQKLIAVLPGSRKGELKYLLPVFLDSLAKLQKEGLDFKAVIPVAKPSLNKFFQQYQEQIDNLNIKLVDKNAHNVLKAADFGIITSGTATLEAMLCKLPMVMAYKGCWITALIVNCMLKIKSYSLPNILADKQIIPELLQMRCNAENISQEILKIINNKEKNQNLIQEFDKFHRELIVNTDEIILQEIENLVFGHS